MVFTEEFMELAIESWTEWDIKCLAFDVSILTFLYVTYVKRLYTNNYQLKKFTHKKKTKLKKDKETLCFNYEKTRKAS